MAHVLEKTEHNETFHQCKSKRRSHINLKSSWKRIDYSPLKNFGKKLLHYNFSDIFHYSVTTESPELQHL